VSESFLVVEIVVVEEQIAVAVEEQTVVAVEEQTVVAVEEQIAAVEQTAAVFGLVAEQKVCVCFYLKILVVSSVDSELKHQNLMIAVVVGE